MPAIRPFPRHILLVYPCAHHLGVDRRTLSRAIRGSFPNDELVSRYRAFVLEYIDALTFPRSADTPLSPQAKTQTDNLTRLLQNPLKSRRAEGTIREGCDFSVLLGGVLQEPLTS